jgi:hypothetical protein
MLISLHRVPQIFGERYSKPGGFARIAHASRRILFDMAK